MTKAGCLDIFKQKELSGVILKHQQINQTLLCFMEVFGLLSLCAQFGSIAPQVQFPSPSGFSCAVGKTNLHERVLLGRRHN
jgi:hypothetical protein